MTSTPITRITMLKIPNEQHQTIAVQGYETFTKTHQRDGKPYILSMQMGHASGTILEQGYTLMAKAVYATQEDMDYYDTQCEAHMEYKKFLKANAPVEGLMTAIFRAEVGF